MTRFLRPHQSIIDGYSKGFDEHGVSPLALGWTKDKQGIRYEALTKYLRCDQSVLDYGCGFADLRTWMRNNNKKSQWYTGVDVVKQFVDSVVLPQDDKKCSVKHIVGAGDIARTYDHIVLCGVFNRFGDAAGQHWDHIKSTLDHLFAHCRQSLHVDFLRDDTADTRVEGHIYVDIGAIAQFICTLGTRYEVDCSYMPYEFCVHVFADDGVEIKRNAYQERIL